MMNLKNCMEKRIEQGPTPSSQPPTNSPEGESLNPRKPLPPRGKTEGGSRGSCPIEVCPTPLLRKHGCAPSAEVNQLWENVTMLISRWLATASGISAILTKSRYSRPLLITDFLNPRDGRRSARLLLRDDMPQRTACPRNSMPSLKVWVAGSGEMLASLPELWTLLSGMLPDGQKPWLLGMTPPSGSLSALTSPSTPVSMDYWQPEPCSGRCSRDVI